MHHPFVLALAVAISGAAPDKPSREPAAVGGPLDPAELAPPIIVEGRAEEPPRRWSPAVDRRLQSRYGSVPYRPLNWVTIPF